MTTGLPPTHFLLALVVMVVLHLVLPVYRYWSFPVAIVGGVPLIVGVLLNLAADRRFKERQTTVKPFERPSALITTFPFSISRNPMYFGMVLMLFGVALFLGSVSCMVPVAAFAYSTDSAFIRVEERVLWQTFGMEWERYCSRARRWI